MGKFKYKSNCTSKSLFVPFASDTNNCETKREALKFMRNLEKELINIIEQTTNCESNYYIFGDKKIIATVNMYDNASLIAETLASFSPYYSQIDVINHEGLRCHNLAIDYKNNRRNRINYNF